VPQSCLAAAFHFFGLNGLKMFLGQSLVAFSLLEIVNFIEHCEPKTERLLWTCTGLSDFVLCCVADGLERRLISKGAAVTDKDVAVTKGEQVYEPVGTSRSIVGVPSCCSERQRRLLSLATAISGSPGTSLSVPLLTMLV
jgi:hypothetical protein